MDDDNTLHGRPRTDNVSAAIRDYVDRLVRLRAEKKALADDIKELKLRATAETGVAGKSYEKWIEAQEKGIEALRAGRRDLDRIAGAFGVNLDDDDPDEAPPPVESGDKRETPSAPSGPEGTSVADGFLPLGEIVLSDGVRATIERRAVEDEDRSTHPYTN